MPERASQRGADRPDPRSARVAEPHRFDRALGGYVRGILAPQLLSTGARLRPGGAQADRILIRHGSLAGTRALAAVRPRTASGWAGCWLASGGLAVRNNSCNNLLRHLSGTLYGRVRVRQVANVFLSQQSLMVQSLDDSGLDEST
jgi:hypothetical protein